MNKSTGNVKFILHALGTNGDVFPVLGIAKALSLAGYNVVIVSNDKFKGIIEEAGLPFHSNGAVDKFYIGNTSEVYRSGNWSSYFQYYILQAFRPTFSFVKSEYAKNKNIVVISSCKNNGARAAADVLSIPAIDLVLSPSNIFPGGYLSDPSCWNYNHLNFYQRWLVKQSHKIAKRVCVDYSTTFMVNRERKALGALPYGKNNNKVERLSFGLFPTWFAPRVKGWPDHLQVVGFPLSYFTSEKEALLVEDFIKQNGSPVVFSFGSGVHDLRALQTHCFKVCNQLGLSGILINASENMVIEEAGRALLLVKEMNFKRDLSRCRAILHHGGIGTVGQAIESQVPQLIRPLRQDHLDNAYRVKKLGIGDYLAPKDFSVDSIVEKLKGLVSSPGISDRFAQCRSHMNEDVVFSRIVSEIEHMYIFNVGIS